jgi:hypothetical protein
MVEKPIDAVDADFNLMEREDKEYRGWVIHPQEKSNGRKD